VVNESYLLNDQDLHSALTRKEEDEKEKEKERSQAEV
jgi:hypothetical protein